MPKNKKKHYLSTPPMWVTNLALSCAIFGCLLLDIKNYPNVLGPTTPQPTPQQKRLIPEEEIAIPGPLPVLKKSVVDREHHTVTVPLNGGKIIFDVTSHNKNTRQTDFTNLEEMLSFYSNTPEAQALWQKILNASIIQDPSVAKTKTVHCPVILDSECCQKFGMLSGYAERKIVLAFSSFPEYLFHHESVHYLQHLQYPNFEDYTNYPSLDSAVAALLMVEAEANIEGTIFQTKYDNLSLQLEQSLFMREHQKRLPENLLKKEFVQKFYPDLSKDLDNPKAKIPEDVKDSVLKLYPYSPEKFPENTSDFFGILLRCVTANEEEIDSLIEMRDISQKEFYFRRFEQELGEKSRWRKNYVNVYNPSKETKRLLGKGNDNIPDGIKNTMIKHLRNNGLSQGQIESLILSAKSVTGTQPKSVSAQSPAPKKVVTAQIPDNSSQKGL